MNILVTGGAGYVGSMLIPKLIQEGHKVICYDLFIYGEHTLINHPSLKKIKGDIRDTDLLNPHIKGIDTVIHLACISNDPSFDLDPKLGKSINLESFEPLIKACVKNGVSRFINASSSSVYGIKKEKNVTEDSSLEPLTDYSNYKAQCEMILNRYTSNDFTTVSVRPATVCGYSKRQRLDVIVNILTNHAHHNSKIKIFGGKQLRPNIHINDMVSAYLLFVDCPSGLINGQSFNVGFENHSVEKLSQVVNSYYPDAEVERIHTEDERSYHINSDKIKSLLGFEPRHTISDAVSDLKKAFDKGLILNSFTNSNYYNIERMQELKLT